MTRTVIANLKDKERGVLVAATGTILRFVRIIQTTKVTIDKPMTVGTNIKDILSASLAIGALDSLAFSTKPMIWEMVVSFPTEVTLKVNEPFLLMVAPITLSPLVL